MLKKDIQKLDKRHDRASFECSNPTFTAYFRKQARQDVEKLATACYVAVSDTNGAVLGFYTLSCTNVPLDLLSVEERKHLASYPLVPAILLGRLAVSSAVEGKGVGKTLLADALIRAYELSGQVAAFAVIVDAIDENARSFYLRCGFIDMASVPMRLFIPMATIKEYFGPRA